MQNRKIITSIGGGTGQSTILRGLKNLNVDINAIVTMADNGGSSGLLREDLGMLPPGDIRNCIVALADMEPDMESLIEYRFSEGRLKGQSFGNLFLAALNEIYSDFELAVSKISKILRVKGNIRPVTLDTCDIEALLKNGNRIIGESIIAYECKRQESYIEKVNLVPNNVRAFKGAIDAIEDADIIVIGPGSLYTSIIPNLLVNGVADKIKNSKAKKVYISNIMTEDGETNDFTVSDFVKTLYKHADFGDIDYLIINEEVPNEDIIKKYQDKNQTLVKYTKKDKEYLEEKNIIPILANLIEIKSRLIYHSGEKITKIIGDII